MCVNIVGRRQCRLLGTYVAFVSRTFFIGAPKRASKHILVYEFSMVWVSVTEKDTGKTYFVNRSTGETASTKPDGEDVLPASEFEDTHYSPEKDHRPLTKEPNDDVTTEPIKLPTGIFDKIIEDHNEELKKLQCEVQVPWIVHMIYTYPCRVICLSMGTSVVLILTLLILMLTQAIKFELDTDPSSFNVKFDDMADRYDAFRAAETVTTDVSPLARNTDTGYMADFAGGNASSTHVYSDWYNMAIAYEAKNGKEHDPEGNAGGNIFEEKHLKEILEFEEKVLATDGYKKFCPRKNDVFTEDCMGFMLTPKLLTHATEMALPSSIDACCDCNGNKTTNKNTTKGCAPKQSTPICISGDSGATAIIPNGGASTYVQRDMGSTLLPNIAQTLACTTPVHPAMSALKSLLDKKFSVANPISSSTRAYLPLGVWFKLSDTPSGTVEEKNEFYETWDWDQWKAMTVWGIQTVKKMIEEHNADDSNLVRIASFAPGVIDDEIIQGILGSARVVVISIVCVSAYMIYHTKSIFLGMLGQAHVMASFPVTWFLYRVVFQLKYMGMLNFISMFVIIGIGADDIFVFCDAWAQARLEGPVVNRTLETRLAWAYKRAASAMLITSLTDACAFYVNIVSTVVVVRIFGIFMGTMVLVNYILVITWFPAVLVIYTRLYGADAPWEGPCFGICKCRCKRVCPCCAKEDGKVHDASAREKEAVTMQVEKAEEVVVAKDRAIEVFFKNTYAPTLFKSGKTRAIVAVVFFVVTGVFFGFATQIKASEKDFKAESFLNTTNLMRVINTLSRFEGSNDYEVGTFLWGMGADGMVAVDRSQADNNNPRDFGIPVFDKAFDPYLTSSQQHVRDTCALLRKNEYVTYDPLFPREGGVYCFMDHFRDWVVALNKTFPVPSRAEFAYLIANFTSQKSPKECQTTDMWCQAYYDTIKNYPSTAYVGADDLHKAWHGYVRWHCKGDANGECQEKGSISNFLIRFNVSISWQVGALYARPIADSLESVMTAANSKGGDAMTGFQFIRNLYVNMRTQEVMYISAFTGSAVSGVVAFLVLCVSTMNVLVSFYAMVNIVGIVICCIGFMVAAGWQLGTIEGICITVCIGFSVDFVVHVAIAYIESNAETRYERTRVALGEMGISVLGATLTTGISSLIMIAAPMIPFSKIGIFVTFDIFVSLLFAVGLYPSMLASFGPEGTSGSIRWLLCHNACPYRKTTGAKSATVAPL